jgi:hypothetical protein
MSVSALATTSPSRGGLAERPQTERPAMRLFEPQGVTLEDTILDVWEALSAGSTAACPVCDGALTVHGCARCESELS